MAALHQKRAAPGRPPSLSYGEPQGEWDLRQALCGYVRKHRNILCSPEDIVVGAGMQSLLHILCPLLPSKKTVSFPTPSFIQGSRIFEDYGFDVHYRDKECDVIYVSPAHMTKWGNHACKAEIELIHLAAEKTDWSLRMTLKMNLYTSKAHALSVRTFRRK